MYPYSPSWDRSLRWTSLLLLTAVLPVFVTATPVPGAAESGEKPALRVEDETISQQEFDKKVRQMMNQMKRRQKAQKKSGQSPELDNKKLKLLIKQRMKKQLVNRLVLKVHAENEGVQVTQEELDRRWDRMVKRFGSEKKFKKVLSNAGETPESVRSQIRDSIRVEKFVQKKTPEPAVSDEEARSFYDKNKKRLKGKSFESVKPRIKQMLKKRKQKRAMQKLVKRLKKRTEVEVNV